MLPVLELAVAAVVAGPPAFHWVRHPPRLCRDASGKTVLDMSDPAAQQWKNKEAPRFTLQFAGVAYLNAPGILAELGISSATTWPHVYQPDWSWPIGLAGFCALTWPIWALPFWVAAGRGIDGLFRRCRITALEAFVMGALSLLIVIVVPWAGFGESVAPEGPFRRWSLVPLAMWFAFGVICQVAWWLQRRRYGRYGDGNADRWMRRYC
jgi:hypothetical protein